MFIEIDVKADRPGLFAISPWRQGLSVALTAPSCAALLSLWLPLQLALLGGAAAALAITVQWYLARTEGDQQRILLSSQWSLLATLVVSLAVIWWQGPLAALAAAISLAPGWAWFSSERAFGLQLAATATSLLLAISLGQDAGLALLCLAYLPVLWLCLMPAQPNKLSEQNASVKAAKTSKKPKKKFSLHWVSLAMAPVLLLALASVLFLLSPRFQGAGWLPFSATTTLRLNDSRPLPATDAQQSIDQLQQQWLLTPYAAPKSPPPPSSFPAFGESFALNQLPEQATDGPMLARVKSPLGLNLQVSRFDLYDDNQWINTAQQQEAIALPADGLRLGSEDRITLRLKWLQPSGSQLAVPGGWQWLQAPSEVLILGAQSLSLPQTPPPDFSYSLSSHALSLDGHSIAQLDGVLHPNYLQVPEALSKPLQNWVAANVPNLPDNWQKALWLEHHLQTQYGADRAGVAPSYKRDPILFYLNEHHSGRSETAASTLTLLLRSLGISARLSCGWALNLRDPFTGLFELSAANAHCYSEAYINNHGWVELEPSALFAKRPSPGTFNLGAGLLLSYLQGQLPWLAFTLITLCVLTLLGLSAWLAWQLWPLAWNSPKAKLWRLKRLAAKPINSDDPAAASLATLINACELIGYHFPPGTGIDPWACLWQTLVPSFDAVRYCSDYNHHHFGLNTQGDIAIQQQELLKALSEMPWGEMSKWVGEKKF